jgi:molybdopterin synthase catalytic subunit
MIRVQAEPFDPARVLDAFARDHDHVGAVATFTGRVRVGAEGPRLIAMTLEHYPGMTERKLAEIEAEAHRRWPLAASLILHRFGRLVPGEPIVMVATAAAHRDAAFDACRFLIDWLKTKAPFWKYEETEAGGSWVAAKASDDAAEARWNE